MRDKTATIRRTILMAAVGLSGAARAGTIRDDVPDSLYTALAADPKYQSVGMMTFNTSAGAFMGSGTLLSPTWVLTAAHCVDNSTESNVVFQFSGVNYSASSWLANPSWTVDLKAGYDIGLVHLATPVTNVTPAARFTGASEVGLVGTSVGYGKTGTGLTGSTLGPGTKRAGQNVLDATGSQLVTTGPSWNRYSDRIVLADFDSPSTSTYNQPYSPSAIPLPLEYMIAPGDSGGGLFVDVSGQPRLAAVHSFNYASDGVTDSSYGDTYGSTRVNQFNSWIDDTIAVNWNNTLGGSFAAGANWTGAATPTASDIVGFKTPGTYTVTLPAGGTSSDRVLARAGQVTLNLNGSTYQLTGSSAEGSLIVGKYSGNNATVTISNGALNSRDAIVGELAGSTGTLTVAAGGRWQANGSAYVGGGPTGAGGAGTLVVNAGGSASVTGTLTAFPGGTINYNGGSLSAGAISIADGAKLLLTTGADKVLRAGSLSITGAGKLDLADNDMILDYSGASPADQLRQYLLSGRAGGAWGGAGITSSAAAADARHLTAIGYAENSALGLDSYAGAALDSTALILKYTYYGDANLDGTVNIDDYTLLDRSLAAARTNTLWTDGDFNYDGVVNAQDYVLIDAAYTLQTGALSPQVMATRTAEFGDGYATALMAAIPEPSVVALLAVGSTLLATRRRRT